MRFMLIVKASRDSEAGARPGSGHARAMLSYREGLKKAGVFLAAEDLLPSSEGMRLTYPAPGERPLVTTGPFAESGGLAAGFTMIEVSSREEAIEWALRMPDPHGFGEGVIELRRACEFPESPLDFTAR